MLACILNIKEEKFFDAGSIKPALLSLGAGFGPWRRNSVKKEVTPKPLIALPKKTGVKSPLSTLS